MRHVVVAAAALALMALGCGGSHSVNNSRALFWGELTNQQASATLSDDAEESERGREARLARANVSDVFDVNRYNASRDTEFVGYRPIDAIRARIAYCLERSIELEDRGRKLRRRDVALRVLATILAGSGAILSTVSGLMDDDEDNDLRRNIGIAGAAITGAGSIFLTLQTSFGFDDEHETLRRESTVMGSAAADMSQAFDPDNPTDIQTTSFQTAWTRCYQADVRAAEAANFTPLDIDFSSMTETEDSEEGTSDEGTEGTSDEGTEAGGASDEGTEGTSDEGTEETSDEGTEAGGASDAGID